MMKDMEHRIAMELFNLRRVVDDGNFHELLENNRLKKLQCVHHIPVCCKILLEGQLPPLHIKLQGVDKNDNLHIFASYRELEPCMSKHSQMWAPYKHGQILRFYGEKTGAKVGQRVFFSKYLYAKSLYTSF